MRKQFGFALIAAMAISTVTASLAQAPGAATYKAKCQMCHAADGSGNKAMKVNSFSGPETVSMSDADLIAIVQKGKGKMPAYSGKLTDPQITDVVAYIRTLQKK